MRRAQAAMEYLITYGWAVLIMLVVVAVLFYLGVFNPKTIAACSFQTPGFTCYTYKIASFAGNGTNNSSGLVLDLGQATGHDIKIIGFNCTTAETYTVIDFTATGSNVTIPSGSHKMLNGSPTSPQALVCWMVDGSVMGKASAEQYYKGKVYVHYVDLETNLDHKVIGDISGKIE